MRSVFAAERSPAERNRETEEEEAKIRKYRPFALPTQYGTGRFHVSPLDCCKKGERDICCDAFFCPCCLWAKLKSNVDFAKSNSRLYEETSSSSDDDDKKSTAIIKSQLSRYDRRFSSYRYKQNARVPKSELSRYEQRFSSDRSYYDCGTCVQIGFSCLPLSAISTLCLLFLVEEVNKTFHVEGNEKHEPLECCYVCCGEYHAEAGKNCDTLALFACTFSFFGQICTPLYASFYARELRHRQLYDGGCISAATPQVPNRNWLRKKNVQLIKFHGQTRMKLAFDIYRVTWIVTKFVPKLNNRYQFFDKNLEIPQME